MKKLASLTLAMLLALLVAACAPASRPAPVYDLSETVEDEPPPPPAPVVVPDEYEVSKGDTLIAIAMHYDLDYRELARWNNIRNPNVIQPGQRLRLTAPTGDPVVRAVPRQNAPSLQPASPSAATQADAPKLVPSAPSTPTPAPAAPAVQRETTLIGAQPASPAPAPGTAPYKTGPQAIKYAYSNNLLKKLQAEWRTKQAAGATRRAASAATNAATTAASAAPTPAPAAPKANTTALAPTQSAPKKTRQKYGVTWGLPVNSAMIKKYSEQSKGVAFGGERGTPVFAAADGEVIYVGTGVKSYGRLVILRHENNYLSAYGHNEEILVKEGQRVSRGSQIASMGDSGSERIMLHFEIRKEGKPLNPAQVLPK